MVQEQNSNNPRNNDVVFDYDSDDDGSDHYFSEESDDYGIQEISTAALVAHINMQRLRSNSASVCASRKAPRRGPHSGFQCRKRENTLNR